jgi:hypothetical protein
MADAKTITLTAESYAEAVGNLVALRQLASELAEVFADSAEWGRKDDATRGAEAMVEAIDRILRALSYEGS